MIKSPMVIVSFAIYTADKHTTIETVISDKELVTASPNELYRFVFRVKL